MDRNSVSGKDHELNYQAHKEGTSKQVVKDAKKEVCNQRKNIEKKVQFNSFS